MIGCMLIEMLPSRTKPREIKMVADALKSGQVIVYPTDTCYGIGADIFNKSAIEKVYQIKGVPKATPLSFVCADLSDISRYAFVTDFSYRILKRYLPGPYTFILKGSKQVPKMMLTKRKTVGIRMPDHPVCMEIVTALGNPLISTSANINGGPIESDPKEITEAVGDRVAYVIDSGLIHPEPSSVISLVDDEPKVIRQGKGDVSDWI